MTAEEVEDFINCERAKNGDSSHAKFGIDSFHLMKLMEHYKLDENEKVLAARAEVEKAAAERGEMEIKRATPSDDFILKMLAEIT